MTKKHSMSLKKIAEEANLSIATVSRALRNRKEVSSKTRRKVHEIAKKMQYRPNMLIRGIQTGKTQNIGVMVPPYNPYWSSVLSGIHDGLVASDFVPIALWDEGLKIYEGRESYIIEQIHRLIDRRVDGMILWPKVSETFGAHLDELESRRLPVVTVDHELEFSDSVETDEHIGAKRIVTHLYNLGHRHIGHLAGSHHWSWAKLRRKCFEAEVAEYSDMTCEIVETQYDEDAPEMAKKLLLSKTRPTAIFACSDTVAFEIYKVAFELDIKIPQELSVVGCSDTHKFVQLINPPLTTVKQYPRAMGQRAAQLLIDRLNGKNTNPDRKRVRMPCELIVRGSTTTVPK